MYLFSLNIYDFAKYIAGCRAKKINLCCIMPIAKIYFKWNFFFNRFAFIKNWKNCTHHLRYVIWTIFIPSWAEVLNLQWTVHLVTGSFWSVQKTDFLLLQCFCFLTWISVNSVHWIIRTIWKINYSTEHFDCQGN